MVSNPTLGDHVRVWYRASMREYMPYHGRLGQVVVVCKGRPRNHGIAMMRRTIKGPFDPPNKPDAAIPAGNLQALTFYEDHYIHTRRVKGGWVAAYICDNGLAWKTVLGTHQEKPAALDAARLAIDMKRYRLKHPDTRTVNPVPDARDRRRSLWWHKEAQRRRSATAVQESRP